MLKYFFAFPKDLGEAEGKLFLAEVQLYVQRCIYMCLICLGYFVCLFFVQVFVFCLFVCFLCLVLNALRTIVGLRRKLDIIFLAIPLVHVWFCPQLKHLRAL